MPINTNPRPCSALVRKAGKQLLSHFGVAPVCAGSAPGRVNLIGDHTDYNSGLVLPIAIDRRTVVVAARTPDKAVVQMGSSAFDGVYALEPHAEELMKLPLWCRYIAGVLAGFRARGVDSQGMCLWVESDVPLASGLSSSAALEVALATLLESFTGHTLGAMEKARLCQRAEASAVGVPCGIMDQAVSVLGRAGHALLLDCSTSEVEQIPLRLPDDLALVVIDSAAPRSLADSAYATRRQESAAAARSLGVPALGSLPFAGVAGLLQTLSPLLQRRARHVVTECERVRRVVTALREESWNRMGALLNASHVSLRDDFQVSCDIIETLRTLASDIAGDALLGMRMTGGGFGGCAVALLERSCLKRFTDQLLPAYEVSTGLVGRVFEAQPSNGAEALATEDFIWECSK